MFRWFSRPRPLSIPLAEPPCKAASPATTPGPAQRRPGSFAGIVSRLHHAPVTLDHPLTTSVVPPRASSQGRRSRRRVTRSALRALTRDAAAAGQPKGLIVLGHMLSEDFGMFEVGEWLRGFLPEVPLDWISAGEPFW